MIARFKVMKNILEKTDLIFVNNYIYPSLKLHQNEKIILIDNSLKKILIILNQSLKSFFTGSKFNFIFTI